MKIRKIRKTRFLCLLAAAFFIAGCTSQKTDQKISTESPVETEEASVETEEPQTAKGDSILASLPKSFYFSSGVGGWSTELQISPDGTFHGNYQDTDMGDTGDKYPNGTVYVCNFTGTVSKPEKVDDYTYSMNLLSIQTEGTPGEAYYDSDTRYVYSDPNGLDKAEELLLYLPGHAVEGLPQGFLEWSGIAYSDVKPVSLEFYGLYNVNGDEGFVGYPDSE